MIPDIRQPAAPRTVLVIGIGNGFREDDAAGPQVARRIAERDLPCITVVEALGVDVAWLDTWTAYDRVYLVDAVAADQTPGRVHCWELAATDQWDVPAARFRSSTHNVGPAELVWLARALHQFPRQLILIGIEGATFDYGYDLSPAVAAAVRCVVRRILDEAGQPA